MKKCLLVVMLLPLLISGCARETINGKYNSYGRTVAVMGTFMEIKVRDNKLSEKEVELIIDRAFQLADSLERKLSIYNAESEINLLNTRRSLAASQDLYNVLKAAGDIGILTEGAFDITVSPVLKRDGFYSDMPEGVSDNIPDTVSGIGWTNVSVTGDREITLSDNTWLDLSGIAKGYIVDSVAEFLRGEGLEYFLINAGGDIYCADKETDTGWLVGIIEPDGNSVLKILSLKNMAIATSGDYENVIIEEQTGEAVSHIIDPGSKEALIEKPSSVTVIALTCTDADAFATGMMVMGEDRAIALADRLKSVEIITAHRSGTKDVIRYSNGAGTFVTEDRP